MLLAQDGLIAVWSGDSRKFDVRHMYQVEGRIMRCVFATNSILHPLPEGFPSPLLFFCPKACHFPLSSLHLDSTPPFPSPIIHS